MTTVPTPNPSGPPDLESLIRHHERHQERPVADCPWCPYPDRVAEPAKSSPALLGRALLGVANDERHLFLDVDDDDWHNAGWGALTRAEVGAELHDITEVLLVPLAAGKVLEAAEAVARKLSGIGALLLKPWELELVAAVTMVRDRPEPARDSDRDNSGREIDSAQVAPHDDADTPAVCILTTDRDAEAFAALPDCPACEGTGKDLPPDWRDTPAEPSPAPVAADLTGPGYGQHQVFTSDAACVHDEHLGNDDCPGDVQVDVCAHCGDEWPCEVAAAYQAGRASRTEPEPVPEPDSVPGWDRATVVAGIEEIEQSHPYSARQLRALLTGWARLARERDTLVAAFHKTLNELEQQINEVAAARTELAEVTAERDRWQRHAGRAGELTAELATARRDAAAGGAALVASHLIPAGTAARDDAQDLIDDLRTGARTIPVSELAEDGGAGDAAT